MEYSVVMSTITQYQRQLVITFRHQAAALGHPLLRSHMSANCLGGVTTYELHVHKYVKCGSKTSVSGIFEVIEFIEFFT